MLGEFISPGKYKIFAPLVKWLRWKILSLQVMGSIPTRGAVAIEQWLVRQIVALHIRVRFSVATPCSYRPMVGRLCRNQRMAVRVRLRALGLL